MTPDEMSPAPVDEPLLAQMMACDVILHASYTAQDRECAGPAATTKADDRARSRLMLLLTMLEAAEAATDQPGDADAVSGREGRDQNRTVLGRFEVIDDLGSGGFGFVVRARDRLLGREVALKMPLPARVLTPGEVHGFLREARAAARLDHPNIVRVHDAGQLGPLGYFIASEFCQGPSLRHWLKSRNEPVPARLAASWLAALADAVQHAHDRGILHRDIKPDNVILTGDPGPADFIPRLTDFGLAKLVEETGDETRSDARLGTPHYMAPEQAAGRRRDVGPATDVYALGATLYEVLTGRPPFRDETHTETLRLVLDTEPVPLRSLRPGLPRDLETICLKCLRKEPGRRYATAAALRDDLRRFLDGRPILGRPVSAWERARGCARRRPAVAALLGLVVLLVGGLAGGIAAWASWLRWHSRQLENQIARADRQIREAEEQHRRAEGQRRFVDRYRYAESLRRAREALDAHQFELAQDILHDLRPGPADHDQRGFAWRYLWGQATRDFCQFWGHKASALIGTAAPDGLSVVTLDHTGNLLIWDLDLHGYPDRAPSALATRYTRPDVTHFSADARYLAVGLLNAPASPKGVEIFDVAARRRLLHLELHSGQGVSTLAFDDWRKLFERVVHQAGSISLRIYDLANLSAAPRSRQVAGDVSMIVLSPDARLLAVQRGDQVTLEDPVTGQGQCVLEGQIKSVLHNPSFSADGRFFAARAENELFVWETDRGRRIGQATITGVPVVIELSSRGRYLAWLEENGRLAVLEPAANRLRELFPGSSSQEVQGYPLSISSDERLLARKPRWFPGGPQPAEVWDLESDVRVAEFPGRNEEGFAMFIPGRHDLLVANASGPRIWRLDPPTAPDAQAGHAAEAWAAAFSPDGKILATGSDDTHERQTIKLWDPASGRLLAGWKAHTATVSALAFSPDGRLLASSSLDSGQPGNPNLLLWDAASHQRLASLEGHTARVRSVAFSPDGRMVASASDDLTARLWDVAGKSTRAILAGHTKNLTSIAFSPDGRLLASASNDSTVRLWDVATGRAQDILQDVGNVLSVAFAPNGSLLASENETGEIKLWDPRTGDLVRTIHGEADQLRCLAFTPDGRNIVTAGKGKVIRIWDVAIGQELLSLEGHKAQINALAFSLDGLILASCSHDGVVKLWRAQPVEPPPSR